MGFKSHSDYVAQGYLLRVDASGRQSKLTPSNPLTLDIYWTSDMATHWKGLVPSSLEPRRGVCCPQLSSQVTALDVWDNYSVIAVDRSLSLSGSCLLSLMLHS